MSIVVEKGRICVLQLDEFFLVDVCEAWVMRYEIWVLFVIDSLNFPSRFDARTFEFGTGKSIHLEVMWYARMESKNIIWLLIEKSPKLVWLTANVSCLSSEHRDSILYLSSRTTSFLIFLDFQNSRAMIVSPNNRIVKNIPKSIGDGWLAFFKKSPGSFL